MLFLYCLLFFNAMSDFIMSDFIFHAQLGFAPIMIFYAISY